jgi:hypothetical protein
MSYSFLALSQNFEERLLVSSRPSVRPSVSPPARTEKLGSHWTDSHEILYLSISQKPAEKFKFC